MLYRFRTFRTSYYFPNRNLETDFLYSIYHPYGGRLSKVYWWLFRHFYIVRLLNLVVNANHRFPHSHITSLMPSGTIASFNMGTPGKEQKISILGLEPCGRRFFAKYSTRPRPIQMSLNEIKVLKALDGTGLAPTLFDYKTESEYVFFRTSYVDGTPLTDIGISDRITDLAISLSSYHIECLKSNDGLKYCLSHGDFTPWNMLIVNNKYQLIDWELAAERPLGYDLFLYISHFIDGKCLKDVYENAKKHIERYFAFHQIKEWQPYLMAFAKIKASSEYEKGEPERAAFYEQILDFNF